MVIYKWTEEQTDEGVAIYATLGACNVLGSEMESCEFFIGLAPEADEIVQALAETALHGNGTKGVPLSGDTITLAFPLWKNTEAESFMFTNGEELLPPITARNGQVIRFVQLVPLFDTEVQFKKEKGEASLWQKFAEKNVPYWSSLRTRAF